MSTDTGFYPSTFPESSMFYASNKVRLAFPKSILVPTSRLPCFCSRDGLQKSERTLFSEQARTCYLGTLSALMFRGRRPLNALCPWALELSSHQNLALITPLSFCFISSFVCMKRESSAQEVCILFIGPCNRPFPQAHSGGGGGGT